MEPQWRSHDDVEEHPRRTDRGGNFEARDADDGPNTRPNERHQHLGWRGGQVLWQDWRRHARVLPALSSEEFGSGSRSMVFVQDQLLVYLTLDRAKRVTGRGLTGACQWSGRLGNFVVG